MNKKVKETLSSFLNTITFNIKKGMDGKPVQPNEIEAYKEGFWAGAVLRINIVWHNNETNPGYDCKVLVEYTDHNGKKDIMLDLYDADYNHLDSELDWSDVIRWAYVEDLLPERKEKTK